MVGIADFQVVLDRPNDQGDPIVLAPVGDISIRATCDRFLSGLKDVGHLPLSDIGVSVGPGDTPCSMSVTLTGLTPAGNAILREAASRRGRAALPFSVPEATPADMDPRLVAAMPELHAYYVDNVTWGALHIVLDDGNVDDADVDLCLGWAKERGDHAGANIARLLQAVTPDQRLILHEWWYGRGRFEAPRGVAA
ncbi:hypothetical protein ACLBYG_22220 [Methylobacterium sp. D53M]